MRAGKQLLSALALILLAGLAAPRQALAQRALPAGDLIVNVDNLERPLLLENQLTVLDEVPDDELAVTVPGGRAWHGAFALPAGESVDGHLLVLDGTAELRGRVNGNVVAVDGDVIVHRGAVVTGDVLALRGQVVDRGGEITGEMRSLTDPAAAGALPRDAARAPAAPSGLERVVGRLAGTSGVFISLAVLAFLLLTFARHNLEIVADTVSHSFGRAFVTGLLAQLLLLPTLGMIAIGLILSVIGVLLLPFAVAVFGLLALVAIAGGFLAASVAMGETWTRRRMAQGARVSTPGAPRYLATGLVAVAMLWLVWALLGWVPFAGALMLTAAVLVTWLMATVGFGAALLSRAGIREAFAGRILPPETLTDEYLWATPQFGVPAVKRPGAGPGTSTRTPPPAE